MSSSSAKTSPLWAIVLLAVAALLWWFNCAATVRIETVSDMFSDRLVDPTTIEGAEVEIETRRAHVVPGHNLESMELILQAEQIRRDGTWRLTQIEYDNAPNGRGVESPSVARAWLALLSQFGDSGQSVDQQVAGASMRADPLLLFGLLLLFTGLVAWQWGWFPAAAGGIVLGLYYPIVGSFQPGTPTAVGLATVGCGLMWLSFVVGLKRELESGDGRIWWVVSGIVGAIALWVSPNRTFLLLVALAASGGFVVWRHRADQGDHRFSWWGWGIAGGLTTLALWGMDFASREAAWANGRLHQIHPLHALSWLGLAGVVGSLQGWRKQKSDWLKLTLSAIAALAVVGTMVATKDRGFLVAGLGADLLTHLPNMISSSSFANWVNEHSSKAAAAGTILPVGLVAYAVWTAIQSTTSATQRSLLLATVLPLVVAIAVGFTNLSWWGSVGAGLAILAVLLSPKHTSRNARMGFAAVLTMGVGFAWLELVPLARAANEPELTASDVQSLAERDLAHWLSLRGDEFRSVVLAPPDVTPALYYYGSVKGLGSPFPENGDGFIASVRIASASSPDESLALATQRELSHIVIPSWDGYLDEYARLGAAQPEHSMMAMLHNWQAPRWMRAVSHTLPEDDVFAGMGTTIFAVSETQDNASALSRLGEYFAETKRPQFAAAIAVTLQKSFPSDLSGLVAQAHIAVSQGNLAVFNEALASIRQNVEDERDGDLEFDRRVSLANILMLGREPELSRDQVLYCMDEVDAYLLKTVSSANLYRFILLADSFNEPFPEPELDTFARALLPAELLEVE